MAPLSTTVAQSLKSVHSVALLDRWVTDPPGGILHGQNDTCREKKAAVEKRKLEWPDTISLIKLMVSINVTERDKLCVCESQRLPFRAKRSISTSSLEREHEMDFDWKFNIVLAFLCSITGNTDQTRQLENY